jgi:SAM-dependent methyltransferase
MSGRTGPADQVPGERHGDSTLQAQVATLLEAVVELQRSAADAHGRLRMLEDDLCDLRTSGGTEASPGEPGRRFAAIYDDFTDRFRGSQAEVTAKLEGYLPDVHAVVGDGGVLDVGSGRGEWLTLLRRAGVRARGVDSNPTFVAAGHAQGLDVELDDAIRHLHALPPGSVDMVTAFHVIEHLDIEDLLGLLQAAWAALSPGGCVVLETPNPTNLMMAACDFYNDPTHRSPLPPALTSYLVSSQGFDDIEVRALHPKAAPPQAGSGGGDGCAQLRELVDQVLFGPQDYAVLGYKQTALTS